MVMTIEGYEDRRWMLTPQQFNVPLKIELRAKTDSTSIAIGYAKGCLFLNDKQIPNKLTVEDITDGKFYAYKNVV